MDFQNITSRFKKLFAYCTVGIWTDSRDIWYIRPLKVLNILIQLFFRKDLQQKACALTYHTVLAITPILAILFAIGTGFGLQDMICHELETVFPGQKQLLDLIFAFVKKYLAHANESAFVGVGIILMLWTLYSLLSNIEDTFNKIWGVREGRSFKNKFIAYTAFALIVPVLMICYGGVTIVMTDTMQHAITGSFFPPLIAYTLKVIPWLLSCLIFTLVYIFIPNTSVRFSNAFGSGILCGILFCILEWVFETGQIYVSNYNAIYGSFAFLPLLLIWLQFSWLLCLFGALLTYSAQKVEQFDYLGAVDSLSSEYCMKVETIILAIIVKRFQNGEEPLSQHSLAKECHLPITLVQRTVNKLLDAKLIIPVLLEEKRENCYQPKCDLSKATVRDIFVALNTAGEDISFEEFERNYRAAFNQIANYHTTVSTLQSPLISELLNDR